MDKSSLECLNEDSLHRVSNTLSPGIDKYLQSSPGEGEQLLIKYKFMNPVKLHSMIVKGLPDGVSSGTAPKTLRLFINSENLDFQDAESEPCTQELTLEKTHVETGQKVLLRYVRFQNVNSLAIFIADNYGNDTTKVAHIGLYGTTATSSKIENWKPTKENEM
ncbi:conserved thioredoxin-like protein [Theileria orientalis strain Shintoku]|uniref:Conserved thioredoxin-like protein n=1 Tax=Theileria orientalis strain Shintoku TaxID=869250 RepID=J4C2M5_THEOR|nr:conserved thioredoxin-like protein [Theileria orientalis strain Shintoku]BAM38951.1 conserved thioredoxin-like protein [Theileria orientalis strain Shintoku]|eukprot:XP_009689252.1 conserved thioredoxin-like protein [Theileria orientalis strain Shintoku]